MWKHCIFYRLVFGFATGLECKPKHIYELLTHLFVYIFGLPIYIHYGGGNISYKKIKVAAIEEKESFLNYYSLKKNHANFLSNRCTGGSRRIYNKSVLFYAFL